MLSSCLAANAARLPGPIQNVIVVMFENRAFDHYLGAMALNDSRIAVRCSVMGKCTAPAHTCTPLHVTGTEAGQAIQQPD